MFPTYSTAAPFCTIYSQSVSRDIRSSDLAIARVDITVQNIIVYSVDVDNK